MGKKMETAIKGYIGTTVRIYSRITPFWAVFRCPGLFFTYFWGLGLDDGLTYNGGVWYSCFGMDFVRAVSLHAVTGGAGSPGAW